MSKITRDEMQAILHPDADMKDRACREFVNKQLDSTMRRINQREAEFAELVEAANTRLENEQTQWKLLKRKYDQREAEFAELVEAVGRYVSENRSMIPTYLSAAYEPFLLPTSPAVRLDALANKVQGMMFGSTADAIRAIAAELREGEK